MFQDRVEEFIRANALVVAAIRSSFNCMEGCLDRCTHLRPDERAALDEWFEATMRDKADEIAFPCRLAGCATSWPSGQARHWHENACARKSA